MCPTNCFHNLTFSSNNICNVSHALMEEKVSKLHKAIQLLKVIATCKHMLILSQSTDSFQLLFYVASVYTLGYTAIEVTTNLK